MSELLSGEHDFFAVKEPGASEYRLHEYFVNLAKNKIIERVIPNRRLDPRSYKQVNPRSYFDVREQRIAIALGGQGDILDPVVVHAGSHPQTGDIQLQAVPLDGMPPSWRERFLLPGIMSNVYDAALKVTMYETAQSN